MAKRKTVDFEDLMYAAIEEYRKDRIKKTHVLYSFRDALHEVLAQSPALNAIIRKKESGL